MAAPKPAMKKCPFCAEEIRAEAVVCRYCGRDLPPATIPTGAAPTPQKKRSGLSGCGALLVVLGLVVGIGLMGAALSGDAPAGAARPTATVVETEAVSPTSRPNATVVANPTATPLPTVTVGPTATPAVVEYESGGLGQDRAWWEATYGAGKPALLGQQYGLFEVLFDGDRARHIERQHVVSMPLVGAQREIRRLLPDDAALIESQHPEDRPTLSIELYESASLAARFDNDVWSNSEPGQFIVIYNLDDDITVARVVVAIGNNP